MSRGPPLWVSTPDKSSYLAASLRGLAEADIPIGVDKRVQYQHVVEALARRVAADGGKVPYIPRRASDTEGLSRYSLSQALAVAMVERVWLLRQRNNAAMHSAASSMSE